MNINKIGILNSPVYRNRQIAFKSEPPSQHNDEFISSAGDVIPSFNNKPDQNAEFLLKLGIFSIIIGTVLAQITASLNNAQQNTHENISVTETNSNTLQESNTNTFQYQE